VEIGGGPEQRCLREHAVSFTHPSVSATAVTPAVSPLSTSTRAPGSAGKRIGYEALNGSRPGESVGMVIVSETAVGEPVTTPAALTATRRQYRERQVRDSRELSHL
jgi:hypothetical protein